jgi:peptide/nickel transport system permease protein
VIIEYVFARPGLGSLLVDSVYQRDYGVLQALVLLAVVVFIVTSLIVDVLLGFIDPRLRTKAVT